MSRKSSKKPVYCFIDASNLFYGGEKSLGWKIDYKKLIRYLRRKYSVKKVFYYAGIELNKFNYSPLDNVPINLNELLTHLKRRLKKDKLKKSDIMSISNNIQRIKFYLKLIEFGYTLKLKPVKIFHEPDGYTVKKANCDVDMTFDLMRFYNEYSGVLVLTGDGDFAVVLKYLKDKGKSLRILARGERTAREIRQLAGGDFRDFNYLREILRYE
ncbi:hypothetical protein A3D01_04060 [Candidatus Woesebacteria bacterium RIFCSPHIGHO2_02_FULL_39_13]|uniref:NYN domain-containing protein n=1 Tax=Candidatus Woesebacteria bacterium RIFCSPHIGHO2_02_FULL_39_13 TaxID=1802505 RepID=A0A1F7Z4V4_9BACT|nr:MAG: hypothetical protein A3D01_04060 [Candidatus Woesebacteria bacterium RIFCSPHIGHO2_02_FULL_39_13]OGM38681.1 MAG: hypothetical protein A3E13_04435 [Candidatus Woesebacteria bacterium RIFCSPHIGHO2_12_FULL_40_20]OGM75403.1 MAG: hypothetical protein A3H19_03500 [Candidatus Woesebacteria bacterium RIFCSPLOWO2_12_FULL_39_9]